MHMCTEVAPNLQVLRLGQKEMDNVNHCYVCLFDILD